MFDPGQMLVRKFIDLMPDSVKKRLIQLKLLQQHTTNLGQIPGQLAAIDKMSSLYEQLGVRQTTIPLGQRQSSFRQGSVAYAPDDT